MTAHEPECEYDADCPCHACYPYRHEVDGTPTSEPCEGLTECPDCLDVLGQSAQTLEPGVYLSLSPAHELVVGEGDTFTALEIREQA